MLVYLLSYVKLSEIKFQINFWHSTQSRGRVNFFQKPSSPFEIWDWDLSGRSVKAISSAGVRSL